MMSKERYSQRGVDEIRDTIGDDDGTHKHPELVALKELLDKMDEDDDTTNDASWKPVEEKLRESFERLPEWKAFFRPRQKRVPTSMAPLMRIFRMRPPPSIVELILEKWPDADDCKMSLCTDENKRTIIFHALIGGSPRPVIESILRKDKDQIKAVSHTRINPLVQACIRASKHELDGETKEVIEFLMEESEAKGISPLAHTIAVDEISDQIIHFILNKNKGDDEMLKEMCPQTNLPPLQTTLLKGKRSDGLVARLLGREESLSFNILENLDDLLTTGRSRSAPLQDFINYRMTNRWPVALLLFELYLRIAQIIVFVYTAQDLLESKTVHEIIVVLYVFSAYFLAREIIELSFKGFWYIDLWNCVDAACVALVLASTHTMDNYHFDEDVGKVDLNVKVLLLTTGAFIVAGLVLYLRSAFYPYAIFVGGLLHILFTLGPFLVVSGLMVFAFAFMNYILQGGPNCADDCVEETNPDGCAESCPETVTDSLLLSLHYFYTGPERTGYWWLDQIFGIVFTVILLNVVIAIVSDAWEENQKSAGAAFWRYRVGFLAEIESINRVCHLLTGGWLDTCFRSIDPGDATGGPYSERYTYITPPSLGEKGEADDEREEGSQQEGSQTSQETAVWNILLLCQNPFKFFKLLFKAIDDLGQWAVFDETPWLEAPYESQIHNAEDYYKYNLRKNKWDAERAKWMTYDDYKKLVTSGSFERNLYWASKLKTSNQSSDPSEKQTRDDQGQGVDQEKERNGYVKTGVRIAVEFFAYLLLMPLGLVTLGLLWPRRIRENLFAVHEKNADRSSDEGDRATEKDRVSKLETVSSNSAPLKAKNEVVAVDQEGTNLLLSRMRKLESKTQAMEGKLDDILYFLRKLSEEKEN